MSRLVVLLLAAVISITATYAEEVRMIIRILHVSSISIVTNKLSINFLMHRNV